MDEFEGQTYADYQDWIEKQSKREEKVIMLPKPEDFEDELAEVDVELSSAVRQEYEELKDTVETLEADLDGWTELMEQSLSKIEYDAYKEEVSEANKKLEAALAKLDMFLDVYGVPSPYYTRTIT
jgi:chromosome segregation ATPase